MLCSVEKPLNSKIQEIQNILTTKNFPNDNIRVIKNIYKFNSKKNSII